MLLRFWHFFVIALFVVAIFALLHYLHYCVFLHFDDFCVIFILRYCILRYLQIPHQNTIMQTMQNAIAQNSENAIMQKTIMLKRKCNRDAKRETRENFREYTFTIGG